MSAKWKLHGDDVLEEVRRDDPGLFLRACASLIPQSLLIVTHNTTPVANLSQQELEAILVEDVTQLERLQRRAAAADRARCRLRRRSGRRNA